MKVCKENPFFLWDELELMVWLKTKKKKKNEMKQEL